MPHGLTIDHEGNTWLTDQAMHQVSTQTSGAVDWSNNTRQHGFELILLRSNSNHFLKTVKEEITYKIINLRECNSFFCKT